MPRESVSVSKGSAFETGAGGRVVSGSAFGSGGPGFETRCSRPFFLLAMSLSKTDSPSP